MLAQELDYSVVQNLGRLHSQYTTGNYMLLLSANVFKREVGCDTKKSHTSTHKYKKVVTFLQKSHFDVVVQTPLIRGSEFLLHRNPLQHSDQTVTSD